MRIDGIGLRAIGRDDELGGVIEQSGQSLQIRVNLPVRPASVFETQVPA